MPFFVKMSSPLPAEEIPEKTDPSLLILSFLVNNRLVKKFN
jgi:hypothetical protein